MDSLTQVALGAAIGSAVMHKRHGRKGAIVGALAGLFPDLDVFIPMGDPVFTFTYHRGFSHSLIFCVLFTPVFVWCLSKINYLKITLHDKAAYIAVFLGLWTHALLDAMTIYGTQLWWPLSVPPVGLGSVFIIDPLYSLPLFIGLGIYLFNRSYKAVIAGLVISTCYLGWSAAAQYHVYKLSKPEDENALVLVQPSPFNTILWRILVVQENGYKVGYYSLFDKTKDINYQFYESDARDLPDSPSVSRLKWFTKGYYGVRREGEDIVFSDLRMGLEPYDYVFQFVVNKPVPERFNTPRDLNRLSDVWDRMVRDLDS